jgi:hypothetical protein
MASDVRVIVVAGVYEAILPDYDATFAAMPSRRTTLRRRLAQNSWRTHAIKRDEYSPRPRRIGRPKADHLNGANES